MIELFDTLPLAERLFVRARLATAPLEQIAAQTPHGHVLDVGCGHGVLTALLAQDTQRTVLGIDPDARKIEWARRSVGRCANVELRACTIETLAAERPHAFDTVLVADVLYLLEPAAWAPFLRAALRLLKPGGRLVLKEAEDDGSWRVTKALLQERVMVHLFRRTHSSGSVGFQPRQVLLDALEQAGFVVEEALALARGYSTPHVLFTASPQSAAAPRRG